MPLPHHSFPALRSTLCAALLLVLAPCALTGCTYQASGLSSRTSAHPLSFTSQAQADTTLTIRQSPLYLQARQECHARRFDQAAVSLGRLATSAGLTPEAVVFCRQQQAICLRDAGKPVPTVHPASAATLIPTAPLTPAQADCGPRALALACDRLGVSGKGTDVASLRLAAGTTGKGTTLAGLARAAGSVGLQAKGKQVNLGALERLPGPALAWVDGNHFLTVLSVDGDTVTVHDPNHRGEEEMPTAALLARSGGVLLTLSR